MKQNKIYQRMCQAEKGLVSWLNNNASSLPNDFWFCFFVGVSVFAALIIIAIAE